ncbi:MAG: capsular biosynthesis protein [Halioglobus sp.]|nr:capsular biosynthesis protein [Halioglobus sp.]
MIDLHCHLLPGVDDGPDSLDEALDMARLAVANGISHSVITPHIHPGRYENQLSTLQPQLAAYRKALAQHQINLQLTLGGEVRLSVEALAMIHQEEVPMLGQENGFRIMLLEFPHSHVLPGSDKLVRHLLERNIRPMIAHPERNKDVMRSLDKLLPFLEAGCLLQVTAGSVVGKFGAMAQQRAVEMLERGWVSVLASDAHNLNYRPPELASGRAAAARLIGEAAADDLVQGRPASILGITEASATAPA